MGLLLLSIVPPVKNHPFRHFSDAFVSFFLLFLGISFRDCLPQFLNFMISRYTRPEMGRLWTDQSRWSLWLSIEILSCEAWEREGRIPKEAVAVIRKKAKINPKRIEALEAEVKHDVIAFVSAVAETIGPDARHLHFGLTSSDVVDTAFACQLKKASELLLEDLETLLKALKKLALQYKRTPMIGRPHGIHAEPITFGWKVAGWHAEIARQLGRLEEAKKTISVGKISGAVGTYAHISPQIEKYILDRLGLVSEDVATQVVARDRHAFFFGVLAGVASTLGKKG